MKKVQNEKARYVTRTTLLQQMATHEVKPASRNAETRFEIDKAGYFIWPKALKKTSNT